MAKNKTNIVCVFLLFILTFAVYVNSFGNQFVLDDLELVVDNPLIKSPQNIINIFKVGLFPGVALAENFYRPIQNLSLMFDYSLWQQNPLGYHITNTLIHAINATLIFFIVLLIVKNRRVALIASTLFAVHPIHTAAVAYISGRADPLVTLFGLASLLFFINYLNSKHAIYHLISAVFFVAAILSKEISLALPLLFILYDICFLKKEEKAGLVKTRIRHHWVYFCIVILYVFLRTKIFGLFTYSPIGRLDFSARLLTACYVFLNYLRLLILPLGLHIDRAVHPITRALGIYYFGIVAVLAALAYALIKSYKTSKIIFFALAWFLINFIPVSNLFFPLNALMAEHWMYFPSVGIFILSGVGLDRLTKSGRFRVPSVAFVVAAIVLSSILTIKQNIVWKDRETLYIHALKFSPNRPRLHSYLGNVYKDRGLYAEAMDEFKEAIRLNPKYAQNYNNLGLLYEKMGQYDNAVEVYKKAIEIKPDLFSAYNNLGNVLIKKGENSKAIEAYKKATELSVYDYEIWINLANTYLRTQNFNDSIEAYKNALKLKPDSAEVYYNLGIAYVQINNFAAAKECWEKAVEIDPGFKKARSNLEKLNAADR